MSWAPKSDAEYYTLIILDPDNPQFEGQYIHLLRVNIPYPGRPGYSVVSYRKPFPIVPKRMTSPEHRYVFLVFVQTEKIETSAVLLYIRTNTMLFSLRKFLSNFPLKDEPLAGNFMHGEIYTVS